MLIWDKYQKEYYEVIPVKKIEEKIQEVKILFNKENGKKTFNYYLYQYGIELLQQLIKENCEESEE